MYFLTEEEAILFWLIYHRIKGTISQQQYRSLKEMVRKSKKFDPVYSFLQQKCKVKKQDIENKMLEPRLKIEKQGCQHPNLIDVMFNECKELLKWNGLEF